MGGVRVDARVPVWVDGSRANSPSRTLIGLRGPSGDQRLLVEVSDDGSVHLLDVDLARPGAEGPAPRAGRTRRPPLVRATLGLLPWLFGLCIATAGVALALGFAQASVVQSGSMEPTLRTGDLYIGLSSDLREPAVGDVVLFTARRTDGTPVAPFTHRVVGGDATTGFATKGDANAELDPFVVARSDVASVMVARIPYGGLLVTLRPVLIALLALALGLMLRGGFREDT